MGGRRDRVDPELARLVEQRLERLLAERAPRRADRPSEPGPELGDPAPDAKPTGPRPTDPNFTDPNFTDPNFTDPNFTDPNFTDPRRAPRWPPFTSIHLAVIGTIGVLAVLLAGWAVLRAQPVSLPATAVSTQRSPTGSSPTGSSPTGSSPTGSSPTGDGSATGPTPSRMADGTSDPTSARSRASPAATVVVHVLGAVKRPGLVRLPERSRVQDAIVAAGGLRTGAELGDLNLAQPLTDGQQLVVGARPGGRSELRGGGPRGGEEPTTTDGATASIDLNTATSTQLETLPGVGPVTAAKIIAWREEHGRFSRVEELHEVAGIGPKTYAELAPHCRV